jgi:hypothetical protein
MSKKAMSNMENPLKLPASLEQHIAELIAELKAGLSRTSNLNFEFDEEHQKMFWENAEGLAPFIPGMIHEWEIISGENDYEKTSF